MLLKQFMYISTFLLVNSDWCTTAFTNMCVHITCTCACTLVSVVAPDDSLDPYTQYHYLVAVINQAGEARSDVTAVRTEAALPAGISPPSASLMHAELDTIILQWRPLRQPNGTPHCLSLVLLKDDQRQRWHLVSES